MALAAELKDDAVKRDLFVEISRTLASVVPPLKRPASGDADLVERVLRWEERYLPALALPGVALGALELGALVLAGGVFYAMHAHALQQNEDLQQ